MPVAIDRNTSRNSIESRWNRSLFPKRRDILRQAKIKPKNLREKEKQQPTDSAQLLRQPNQTKVQEIIDLGEMVYTSEGLHKFLSTPLPIFSGHSGFDLIQLGKYKLVLAALAADFEGTGF